MPVIHSHFDETSVEMLDMLVECGYARTRSAAIRKAVATAGEVERRRLIGEQIAQAYNDTPQTDDEHDASALAVAASNELFGRLDAEEGDDAWDWRR